MSRTASGLGISGATLHLGIRSLPTAYGPFALHLFRDLARERTAMAIVRGDPGGVSPLLVRVHSSCITSECLGACDCDCAEQLESALATMARAERGVLFYLMQEGRGAGLTAKARDRMIVQASGHRVTTFEAFAAMGLPADLRGYDEVAPMTRLLGLRAPLRLLTNNPEKAEAVASALSDEKIEICGTQPIQGPDSPFNGDYLDAKERSGHALDRSGGLPAQLAPEPVRVEPPMPAVGAPHLVSTARYLLPIAIEAEFEVSDSDADDVASRRNALESREVDWFRLRVVLDRRTSRESIVLSPPIEAKRGVSKRAGTDADRGADLGHTMDLVDRLPSPAARGRRALHARLRAIRTSGVGSVVVGFDETGLERERVAPDALARRRVVAEEILEAAWPDPSGARERDDVAS